MSDVDWKGQPSVEDALRAEVASLRSSLAACEAERDSLRDALHRIGEYITLPRPDALYTDLTGIRSIISDVLPLVAYKSSPTPAPTDAEVERVQVVVRKKIVAGLDPSFCGAKVVAHRVIPDEGAFDDWCRDIARAAIAATREGR